MGRWWMNVCLGGEECGNGRNNIERGKPKHLEMNLFQCQFFNHKSQMDCPGAPAALK